VGVVIEVAPSWVGTSGSTLGLKWLKGYLDAVASGVSVEQFLRKLHQDLELSQGLRCSEIFVFDSEGYLVHAGGHGLSLEQMRRVRLSRDSLHPVSDAARTEEILEIASADEFFQRYPALSETSSPSSPQPGPAIYIPLISSGVVNGVFAMNFAKGQSIEWSNEERLIDFLEAVARVAQLILLKPANQGGLSVPERESTGLSAMGLSDRQVVIAKMIADGMTNKSIAKELGFSEATIRYETIKLYERLRVRNRSHAAARIHQLGIG
jgi:DNA-binding CsgD family transcriptional regulator